MRAPVDIKSSWSDALWELGDVEQKCQKEKQVEDDDPGKEDPDLVAVKAIHNCPMKGWNEAVEDEGQKVCQSHGHVFVLVHLVSEQGSADNKPNDSEHVERTERRVTPESVVDP